MTELCKGKADSDNLWTGCGLWEKEGVNGDGKVLAWVTDGMELVFTKMEEILSNNLLNNQV